MATAVKRAISLPKNLDEELRGLAKQAHRTYSGLIQEAIDRYLKERERSRLFEAYARYYSQEGQVKKDKKLAGEIARFSQAYWPGS